MTQHCRKGLLKTSKASSLRFMYFTVRILFSNTETKMQHIGLHGTALFEGVRSPFTSRLPLLKLLREPWGTWGSKKSQFEKSLIWDVIFISQL